MALPQEKAVLAVDGDDCVVRDNVRRKRSLADNPTIPTIRIKVASLQEAVRKQGLYKIYKDVVTLAQTDRRDPNKLSYQELVDQAIADEASRKQMDTTD